MSKISLWRKGALISLSLAAGLALSVPAQAAGPCAAPPGWTNHAAVLPPDNNAEPMSNCAFHTWAWNTFLWMTQTDASGAPRFLSFATLEQLFDTSATVAGAAINDAAAFAPKRLVLTARSTKSSQMESLSEIFQAGSNGALIHGSAAGGENAGRILYYSQNVNADFYKFVRDKKYYIAENYLNAPADKNFENGAMEFKYAWKIVEDGEDTTGFFTTDADILLLVEQPDGTVSVDPSKTETAKVALVGVHVVGVVEGHPEFIWATFEHIGNAPDLPAGMRPDSGDPVSSKTWTFYAAGTAAKDSNINNAGQITLTDPAQQLVSPVVNAFRQFAWGGGDAENVGNIQALNASVAAKTLAGDPIWANYQLIGGIWAEPRSLQPNTFIRGLGSVKLSNVTMETFTQSGANCFTCHSTFQAVKQGVTLPGKNMNVSHIMTNGFFRNVKR